MKTVAFAGAILLFVACGAPLAAKPPAARPARFPMEKPATDAAPHAAQPPRAGEGLRVGGETIETAVPIPAIPFTDVGNTCGFVHDYDAMCPYGGSLSPDCVYSYAPEHDMVIDVSLCLSSYDTKVYLYENDTMSDYYACNDDNGSCDTPVWQYQSWIEQVPIFAGNVYYVVVDGYGNDCGEYVLDIYERPECVVECPPSAQLEGEIDCYDGYVDQYNSGCGGTPPVFTPIDCMPGGELIVVCGTGGVFELEGVAVRDTDWYLLTLEEPATVTVVVARARVKPPVLRRQRRERSLSPPCWPVSAMTMR